MLLLPLLTPQAPIVLPARGATQILIIVRRHLRLVLSWLDRHDVPYDELHVGKPWSGKGGFCVDDKAIRPDEFLKLSYDEIRAIVGVD